jgi:HEAT repeat protein
MERAKFLRRANGHSYNLQEKAHINALHAIGLRGDLAGIPALLEVVAHPPDNYHLYTALHALGRLGDGQALGAIEDALRDIDDWEAQAFAQAVKARLQAQIAASSLSAPQGMEAAQGGIERFLHELNLTPAELNKGLANYLYDKQHTMHADINRETFALRQLADQIYRQRNEPLLRVAIERGINFQAEAGAAYKVQLALPGPQ